MERENKIMINYDDIPEIEQYPKLPLGKSDDLRGQKFFRLKPLYRTKPLTNSQKCAYWLTQCDCGNYLVTRASSLKNGSTKSCGCYHREITSQRNFNDITGKRFGRLTALKLADRPGYINQGKNYWDCLCDCGNTITVSYSSLNTGKAISCGCAQREIAKKLGQASLKDLTNQVFGKLTVIKRDLSQNYSRVHWICQCECGNIKSIAANHLTSGAIISCGCYGTSKGEKEITKLLLKNNINFKQEISFDNLKDKKPLRYDFGIYDNKDNLLYLIEFDGIQHFKITGGRGTLEALEKTKKHDEFKNQWCKDNNIPLIRIPYTHFKNLCIEDLLLETTQFKVV